MINIGIPDVEEDDLASKFSANRLAIAVPQFPDPSIDTIYVLIH
jgi:hypothetical protein